MQSLPSNAHFRIGGVPEHFNAPWHLANDRGLFKARNLNVDWVNYPGGTGAMVSALHSGEVDVAILLTEGIFKDIALTVHKRKTDVSANSDSEKNNPKLFGVYVASSLCWGVHTSTGEHHDAINSVNDLKEKRFAVSRLTSGSHLMTFVLADQLGWEPTENELRFEIVGNLNGARSSLKNDESDGFLWEKFTTKHLCDDGEFKRVGEVYTPWPCFSIAVRSEVLADAERVANLKSVLEIVQSVAFEFKENANNRTVEHVSEIYNNTEADAAEWLATVEWACEPKIKTEMLEKVGQTLVDVGVLPKTVVDALDFEGDLVGAGAEVVPTKAITKSVSDLWVKEGVCCGCGCCGCEERLLMPPVSRSDDSYFRMLYGTVF